jgi:uncharacterized membrane protein
MKTNFFQLMSLLLVMLITGVFWGTWFTLTRSIDNFEPECFLAIGKAIIHNVAWPMRIMMPLGIISAGVLTWLMRKEKITLYFTAASLILLIITLIITVAIEVPIDNQIKTWNVDTLPANWQDLRYRWNIFHTIRTFTSISSFVCLSVGIIRNKQA